MKLVYFFIQMLVRLVFKPLAWLFFEMEVDGRENVKPLEGPLIIAPNHKSYIDHFFIGLALPFNFKLFPLRSRADAGEMRRPIIGPCIRILGGFLARTKGKSLDDLFAVPVEILDNKGVVLLYPEAGINKEPTINPLKKYAAELALRASANILPVAISGLDNFYLTDIPKLIFARRKIKISFGKAFPAEQGLNRKELTKKIENEIRALYDPDYH